MVVIKCPECGEETSLLESYDEERFAGEVKCAECGATLLVVITKGKVRLVGKL